MGVSQFKVIRDIAQTSSISRAAQINGISQSAASQLVRQLEKQLRVELLDRTKRPLKLTAAGKIYAAAARDIVRRYREMESQLEALRKELAGTVRVASIYSTGLYQMARMKERFEEQHAQANIHLDYMRPDKVYQAVSEDRADLGLISYPNPGKDLKSIPWRSERMVLAIPPTAWPASGLSSRLISKGRNSSVSTPICRFARSSTGSFATTASTAKSSSNSTTFR